MAECSLSGSTVPHQTLRPRSKYSFWRYLEVGAGSNSFDKLLNLDKDLIIGRKVSNGKLRNRPIVTYYVAIYDGILLILGRWGVFFGCCMV